MCFGSSTISPRIVPAHPSGQPSVGSAPMSWGQVGRPGRTFYCSPRIPSFQFTPAESRGCADKALCKTKFYLKHLFYSIRTSTDTNIIILYMRSEYIRTNSKSKNQKIQQLLASHLWNTRVWLSIFHSNSPPSALYEDMCHSPKPNTEKIVPLRI